MKCRACGFDEKKAKHYGDRGFFQFVQDHSTWERTYSEGDKKFIDSRHPITLDIYACPECGTLRIKSYEIED